MNRTQKKIIVVCGPTASGKTKLAHKLASICNGAIVNADAMQVYKQIPIITASPTLDLTNELPYYLYNFCNIGSEFSVKKYIDIATKSINHIYNNGQTPIVVGGSGMYISMLMYGYSDIPDIPIDIREHARMLFAKIGLKSFIKELKQLDSQMQHAQHIVDPQRAIRAYEVKVHTGKSIIEFQKYKIQPLRDFVFEVIYILPQRKFLYELCNMRLKQMFNLGAIEEVQAIHTQYPQGLNTSAMKALSVQEILSYIKGIINLNQALELSSTKTRQYAKRQITWFTNQITENKRIINFSTPEEYESIIKSPQRLLT